MSSASRLSGRYAFEARCDSSRRQTPIILISVCSYSHHLLIYGLTRAKGIAIVPVSEPNTRPMDFGSTEIVFANEAKLEQNFVTGAGRIFYLSF